MKYLIVTAALCLISLAQAAAQNRTTNVKPTAQEADKACTVPDMSAVKTLGLTGAQQVKVREIHADIERDCAALKDGTGGLDANVVTRYQQRIKDVLTPGQYERYVALDPATEK
jgi:hypothetical protein